MRFAAGIVGAGLAGLPHVSAYAQVHRGAVAAFCEVSAQELSGALRVYVMRHREVYSLLARGDAAASPERREAFSRLVAQLNEDLRTIGLLAAARSQLNCVP